MSLTKTIKMKKNIKYFFLVISSIIILFSCKQLKDGDYIQGSIYIKLIDVNNILYGLPEDQIEKFKKNIANLDLNNSSSSERRLLEYHKILIDEDLYKNPRFKLKTDSGKIINVYTNESEYLKLKVELDNFDRDSEKITVKFEGFKISDGVFDPDGIFDQAIYKAKKIISVHKVKGKTDWDK